MKAQNLVQLISVCYISTWIPVGASGSTSSLSPSLTDRDARLTTPQLIAAYGYPQESHKVTTEDGYILTLHRIPQRSKAATTRVVLLQHGAVCSSADWVVMGPGKGLAYLLSDAGYDVWMGNARGNTYSKGHEKTLSKDQYWNFSFHEMGVYDLPAVIDYILNTTETHQLHYVGHSMGTTMFYVMASERPEYNSKIRMMVSLGPAAYMSHVKNGLVNLFVPFEQTITWLLELVGSYEMVANSEVQKKLAFSPLCSEWAVTFGYCFNAVFLFIGLDFTQINKTMLPVIAAHTPAGTSMMVLKHYSQLMNSGTFQQMDWGAKVNSVRYGQTSPPQYNLSRITTPVALFTGDSDNLIALEDVDILQRSLGRVIGNYRVPYPKFDHLDFLWAIDAKSLLYDDVIRLLDDW